MLWNLHPIIYQALVSSGVSNVTEYNNEALNSSFKDLRDNASAGGGFRRFAVGKKNNQNFTMHVLMQCSPDFSEINCSSSLVNAHNYIQDCCRDRLGMGILFPSCNLRMEPGIFYDSTFIESRPFGTVPAPQLAPPPLPAKGMFPKRTTSEFLKKK